MKYVRNKHSNTVGTVKLCLVSGCTAGFNKTDCSIPCPDVNCEYCQIETGICKRCRIGFEGPRCELSKNRYILYTTSLFIMTSTNGRLLID